MKPSIRYMFLCSLSGILALSACGKGGESKLTGDQKAELIEVLDSAGRAQRAVGGVASGSGAQSVRLGTISTSENFSFFNAVSLAAVNPPVGREDEAQKAMAATLQSRLNEKVCSTRFDGPQGEDGKEVKNWDDLPAGDHSITMEVSGENCPVTLQSEVRIEMKFDKEQFSQNFWVKYNYQVKDPEYAKLNDINAISHEGSWGLTIGQSGVSFVANVQGKYHSQKRGNIKVSIESNVSGEKASNGKAEGSGEATFRFELPNFTAELKQEYDDGKLEYYLNDEEVTKEEFDDLLKRGEAQIMEQGPTSSADPQYSPDSEGDEESGGTEESEPSPPPDDKPDQQDDRTALEALSVQGNLSNSGTLLDQGDSISLLVPIRFASYSERIEGTLFLEKAESYHVLEPTIAAFPCKLETTVQGWIGPHGDGHLEIRATSQDIGTNGCKEPLNLMLEKGFSINFSNVPIGTDQTLVKKVFLQLKPIF